MKRGWLRAVLLPAGFLAGWWGMARWQPDVFHPDTLPAAAVREAPAAPAVIPVSPQYGLVHWQTALAQSDRTTSQDWGTRLLAARDDSFAVRLLAEAWAKQNPVAFHEWLLRDPPIGPAEEFCHRILWNQWITDDPTAACQALQKMENKNSQDWLIRSIAGRWLTGLPQGVSFFRSLKAAGLQQRFLRADNLQAPWITADPQAALLAISKETNGSLEGDFFDRTATLWAERNPGAAALYALQNPTPANGILTDLMKSWLEADPPAAMAALTALPAGAERIKLLDDLRSWIKGPQLAVPLEAGLFGMPESAALARISLASDSVTAPAEWLDLLEAARGLDSLEVRDIVPAAGYAIEKAAKENPAALASLLPQMEDVELRSALARNFAEKWLKADPAAALAWSMALEPEGLRESVLSDDYFARNLDMAGIQKLFASGQPLPENLEENIASRFTHMPDEELAAALEGLPAGQQEKVLRKRLEGHFPVLDADAANQTYSLLKSHLPGPEAAAATGSRWFSQQPVESLAWIQSLPAEERTAALDACRKLDGLDAGQKALLGAPSVPAAPVPR